MYLNWVNLYRGALKTQCMMLLMHDAASTEFMGFFHVHVFKWWLQQGECHLPVAADTMNYLEAGGNGIRATGLSNDWDAEKCRAALLTSNYWLSIGSATIPAPLKRLKPPTHSRGLEVSTTSSDLAPNLALSFEFWKCESKNNKFNFLKRKKTFDGFCISVAL